MFIIANLLFAIAQVLDYVLWAYTWIVIARVVVSLVKTDPSLPVVRFLYGATEPLFQRIRQRWPVVFNGYDLSPMIVLIAAVFLQRFLVHTLYDLANTLK
jgi:YggT family protein